MWGEKVGYLLVCELNIVFVLVMGLGILCVKLKVVCEIILGFDFIKGFLVYGEFLLGLMKLVMVGWLIEVVWLNSDRLFIIVKLGKSF